MSYSVYVRVMTPSKKRGTPEWVELGDGFRVPPTFDHEVPVKLGPSTVRCRIEVEMVDGKPALASFTPERPLLPVEYRQLGLNPVVAAAVNANRDYDVSTNITITAWDEAVESLGDGKHPWASVANALVDAKAQEVAEKATRYRSNDAEFLREVGELYEAGGVPAVRERHPAAERTVRRWLAKAKEMGLR